MSEEKVDQKDWEKILLKKDVEIAKLEGELIGLMTSILKSDMALDENAKTAMENRIQQYRTKSTLQQLEFREEFSKK